MNASWTPAQCADIERQLAENRRLLPSAALAGVRVERWGAAAPALWPAFTDRGNRAEVVFNADHRVWPSIAARLPEAGAFVLQKWERHANPDYDEAEDVQQRRVTRLLRDAFSCGTEARRR